MHGDYINIIIGSRAVSEGVSFKNIQVEMVQTPWFNYASIDQALARGYRAGSHRLLQEENPDEPISLDIYQQASIPSDDTPSVELDMYKLSQTKDLQIKRIQRLMRQSAFDCALSYARNSQGLDYSRDCDYDTCSYDCDGLDAVMYKDGELPPEELDYSTYDLYYANKAISHIIDEITQQFQRDFVLSLDDITENNLVVTEFELLTSLSRIIEENLPIRDRYGRVTYLRENQNLYFLVDNISLRGDALSVYYTRNPFISNAQSYKNLIQQYYITEAIPRIIRGINPEQPRESLVRLPIETKEFFLEGAIQLTESEVQGATKDQVYTCS